MKQKRFLKTISYFSYLFGTEIERAVYMETAVLRGADMVAYEFYWRDELGDSHLVGILPERRKDPTRITNESIMNWVKKIIGSGITAKEIFFFKVNINELKNNP